MTLFKLLKKEIHQPLKPLIAVILLSGLSNALLIEVINLAAENVTEKSSSQRYFMLFFICGGLALYTRKFIFDQAFVIVEDVVNRIRLRIGNKIRFTELTTFEKIGNSPLYARLTQDVLSISDTAWHLIKLVQSLFVVLFMMLYIAYLSTWAFVLVLGGIIISIANYISHNEQMAVNFVLLSKIETNFFEKLSHILSGFKEIKLNQPKSEAVFKNYKKVNDNKRDIRVATNKLYNLSLFSSQVFIYIMIAAIIFVVPHYHEEHSNTIIRIMAAILFIIGPIEAVWNAIPTLAIAENGSKNILDLEKQLDTALQVQKTKIKVKNPDKRPILFQESIQLQQLAYRYENNRPEHAFGVGPMDLTIRRGEVVFVIGGNGSGKSTFLKLFIGLYMPQHGQIYIDRNLEKNKPGTLISAFNNQQYRSLFSTIFTDYHLFDKLYGLKDIEEEKVNELLEDMELPKEKTSYRKGGFTNIKLSSGQKKRLALINAILEDKDIYIFDEVAADLDPWFRDTYYYEIIPQLKARNKTVFVVSHDKEYWHIADRILEMNSGQLSERDKNTISSLKSKAFTHETI